MWMMRNVPGLDEEPVSTRRSARERVAGRLFRFYKTVASPALHSLSVSQCRYLPSCSEYAYAAVVRHGWLRGTAFAVRRLLRCHPFTKGGLDPVP